MCVIGIQRESGGNISWCSVVYNKHGTYLASIVVWYDYIMLSRWSRTSNVYIKNVYVCLTFRYEEYPCHLTNDIGHRLLLILENFIIWNEMSHNFHCKSNKKLCEKYNNIKKEERKKVHNIQIWNNLLVFYYSVCEIDTVKHDLQSKNNEISILCIR